VSGIATWAGQQVLRSLTSESLADFGDAPDQAGLLREVFAIAVRRCLADHEPRAITGYVRAVLDRREVPSDGAAAREAEALIRAALGRPSATCGIDADRATGLMILIVGDLARSTVAVSAAAGHRAGFEHGAPSAGRGSAPTQAAAGPGADPVVTLLAALVAQAERRTARGARADLWGRS
jgi:hypothetical protein